MNKVEKYRKVMRHPLGVVMFIGLAIVITEFLLMQWLDDIADMLSSSQQTDDTLLLIVDPVVLIMVIGPMLYLLLFRPMRFQQAELLRSEARLKEMNASLETKVLERTGELLDAQMELERDVAERKAAETVLLQMQQMLNEAQHLLHLGSWDLDLFLNELIWSKENYRIFEVDPACHVNYEIFLSRVHPDDREMVSRAYTTSVQERSDYDIIHRLLFSDGRVKWVHERCNTFYDDSGKPLRSIGTTQDISAFQQEKEARSRFATILEETPDVVGMLDGDGNFLYLNRAGKQMLEISETDDISSCNFVDYHPEWVIRLLREEGLPTAVAQGTWMGETAMRSRSGKEIPVLQVVVAHKNIKGDIEFYSTMIRDITDRKKLESDLISYNCELQDANRQLHDTRAQLEQADKMASIGQLAAGVAHEINNPIGFVYSNLGSLEQYLKEIFEVLDLYVRAELPDAKQLEELVFLKEDVPVLMKESRDGISRVKKIIQDLKEFSHVDTSDEWHWTDLHRGLDSTLGIVWNEIKYHAEVKKEYGDLPEVECLPSQLNQVFMNLLVNAAHAIETKGVITIRTGVRGDEAFIQIADTGKGISPENLKRIFDPFFTTKPVGKGTGLGLSLSFGIMQKHHGRIEVQSEVGKGTAFTLWLPIKHLARGG